MENLKYYIEERVVEVPRMSFSYFGKDYDLELRQLRNGKRVILDKIGKKKVFESFELDGKKYYLYSYHLKLNISTNLNKYWRRKSNLHSLITRNNVVFYGLYSDISNRINNCDNIYLNDKIVGKIKRPFNFWKFRHLALIKIPLSEVVNSDEIHNMVSIGDLNENRLELTIPKRNKGINYFSKKKYLSQYIIIRTKINSSQIRIVNIPMSSLYSFTSKMKNIFAYLLSKVIGKKNINLMFEKETRKANESGYYVFEKIMAEKNLKSKTFFVIDKDCDDFNKVISKYPKNTIIKYSFKHFLYVYISKYFISSELSNHVFGSRIYIKSLNNEISKKPLIFLQHGIMFSKPVDNPAAAGFNKSSKSVNYYKSVICSDLEATQFYKCGFTDEDLIKCGLPKFDVSFKNPDSSKIMVMLTYRFWEEGMINDVEKIKETTYYKTYMKIINSFKKAGLIDRLIISCHPKFSDCLLKASPEYSNIIETDVNKALENSCIYITDYSSASYDAHYRGSYIIYYWAERDYLIEQYQAIPPINEENCDGIPVFSVDSLIDEVKKAISKKCKMDKKYEVRYRKINEFHDGHNGDRLISELKKIGII